MRPLIVLALIFVSGCSHPADSQSPRSDERGGRQNTEAVPVSTAAEDQDVTQGQLLFEVDPRPFQLALAQAEASAAASRERRRHFRIRYAVWDESFCSRSS